MSTDDHGLMSLALKLERAATLIEGLQSRIDTLAQVDADLRARVEALERGAAAAESATTAQQQQEASWMARWGAITGAIGAAGAIGAGLTWLLSRGGEGG